MNSNLLNAHGRTIKPNNNPFQAGRHTLMPRDFSKTQASKAFNLKSTKRTTINNRC
jgi:hypothetical protein